LCTDDGDFKGRRQAGKPIHLLRIAKRRFRVREFYVDLGGRGRGTSSKSAILW
jgi:hypothetical protein